MGGPADSSAAENSLSTRGERRLACQQCRARKVKCDRTLPACLRCSRLDFTCSYTARSATGTQTTALPLPPPLSRDAGLQPYELTQAGTKRRRIRAACQSCRSVKAKCSGDQPCSRCFGQSQDCRYPGPTAAPLTSPTSPPVMSEGAFGPAVVSSVQDNGQALSESARRESNDVSCALGSERGTVCFEDEPKDVVRSYLNGYFDKIDITECPFLHRGSVMADWSRNLLDPILLKAICAISLRWSNLERGLGQDTPLAWMRQVQQVLLSRLGATTISQLQALMLLLQFHFSTRVKEEVWMLLAMAARIAFTKQLNYERPAADPVTQECLRRLMWSLYQFDKLFSGGLDDLTLCPTRRMHIRLPCSDRSFQRGLRSRCPTLYEQQTEESDMDVLGYRIKLFDLRDRILRYTREVILQGVSPFNSRDTLYALDANITAFSESLPEELLNEGSRLMLMCHSSDARAYVALHTFVSLCRCDLHRFLIPGIRESVTQAALGSTPAEYVNHCQRRCLDSALGLCEFWSRIALLETRFPVDSTNLTIAIYQVAKIVDHLSHMLPTTGNNSLDDVKHKLMQAVALIDGIEAKYEWIEPCVNESKDLIPLLGSRRRPDGQYPADDSTPSQIQIHRRSKHGFAPTEDIETTATAQTHSPNTVSGSPFAANDSYAAGPVLATTDITLADPVVRHGNEGDLAAPVGEGYLPFELDPFRILLHAYADADMPTMFPEGP